MVLHRHNYRRTVKSTSTRTGTKSRTSSALRSAQKQAKRFSAQKARRRTVAPAAQRATNTKAILSNARAISKLSKRVYGPIQQQRSFFDGANYHIIANSPWCCHLTAPGSDQDAPYMYHINALGGVVNMGQFQKFVSGNQHENSEDLMPNNPCFLKSILLEFEFEGYVDDTHIRIDVVQAKGSPKPDWYRQSNTTADNLLPKCLGKFTNLAGFTQERINRDAFKVLATRRLYLNARPKNPTAEDATNWILSNEAYYPTVSATTRNVARSKIYLPINRKLDVLTNDYHYESYGETDTFQDFPGVDDVGVYSYANVDPRKQIWLILSTSDQTALGSALTGDAVQCKIHRTVTWRDKHD